MKSIKPFPIQRDKDCPASTIPWWLAEEAYAHYAKLFGTSQSLERMAERGGFGPEELIKLLRRENPFR